MSAPLFTLSLIACPPYYGYCNNYISNRNKNQEEIYPTLPDGLNGALDASRVKTYLKNSMYPLMYLFGKNSMPDVDNLLTSFYQFLFGTAGLIFQL